MILSLHLARQRKEYYRVSVNTLAGVVIIVALSVPMNKENCPVLRAVSEFCQATIRLFVYNSRIMLEGDYRPQPLEALPTESGEEYTDEEPQAAFGDTAKALMAEKTLKFSSPQKAYDMLLDLSAEAGMDDAMPEDVVMVLHNVALAYGFLVYDQLRDSKQGIFLARVHSHREYFQTDQLELTQDEAAMLQQVAHAVALDYDPGTEMTPEQRIFRFSSVESRPPKDLSFYAMMSGREKPPEHDPLIVDSEPPITSTETTF